MSVTKAIKAMTQVAVAEEGTAGVAELPTRRLYAKSATYREVVTEETFEEAMGGTLARVDVPPVPTRFETQLELPLELSFEQVLLAFLGGLDGSVTPTTPGAGAARRWTFPVDPLVATPPKTFSIQWVESNAAASPTDAGRKCAYGFVTGFTIKGGDSGLSMLDISMVARKASDSAKTELGLPSLKYSPVARADIYIDDAWADLGESRIAEQVYGYEYKFSGYARPGYYHDSRATLDLSCIDYGRRIGELTLDVALDPTEQFPVELAAKEAQELRFVRLLLEGAAFAAPDAGLNRYVKIDGAYYHAADSMAERGRDREGNVVVRMHLLSAKDPVSGNQEAFEVQNDLEEFAPADESGS